MRAIAVAVIAAAAVACNQEGKGAGTPSVDECADAAARLSTIPTGPSAVETWLARCHRDLAVEATPITQRCATDRVDVALSLRNTRADLACLAAASDDTEIGACDGAMQRKPASEARQALGLIADCAVAIYRQTGSFPRGAAPETPAQNACSSPDHRSRGDWSSPTWRALGVRLELPLAFRYSYRSDDGTSFHLSAIGDLDCDEVSIEYTADGLLRDGRVVVDIRDPRPNDP